MSGVPRHHCPRRLLNLSRGRPCAFGGHCGAVPRVRELRQALEWPTGAIVLGTVSGRPQPQAPGEVANGPGPNDPVAAHDGEANNRRHTGTVTYRAGASGARRPTPSGHAEGGGEDVNERWPHESPDGPGRRLHLGRSALRLVPRDQEAHVAARRAARNKTSRGTRGAL